MLAKEMRLRFIVSVVRSEGRREGNGKGGYGTMEEQRKGMRIKEHWTSFGSMLFLLTTTILYVRATKRKRYL